MPVQTRFRIIRSIAALFFVTAFGFVGCRDRASPVEEANASNRLLIGNGAEPANLDPQVVTGSPEARLIQTLFEGLVRYHPATLEPLPGVAQSWQLADDGVTYTFHLRPDARWSDGVPVTAEDFFSAYQRILAPKFGSDNAESLYFLRGGKAHHLGETNDFSLVGCKVIDAQTLQLVAERPTPFFLKLLASRNWFPIPRHVLAAHNALERKGTAWTKLENFVGNGPFLLREWKHDQFIEVEKSPTYWNRDQVGLRFVKFFPMDSSNTEEAAYRSGLLHRTSSVPKSKLDVYRSERPSELRIAPQSGTYYYAFNVKRPPFDDVRVRRALALAVDRSAITREVTQAGEIPARHFTPDGISDYVSPVPGVSFDLDTARQLLAEAGYPAGANFPEVTLLYNTAENHRVIAEAVQQMWRKNLGIEVQIENQEWKVYIDNMHLHNFDFCRAGYIVAPDDPTRFLEGFRTGHGFNISGWSDADYDQLLAASLAETQVEKRFQLFAEMEAKLMAEMPVMPIYHNTTSYLLRPEVKNWTDNLLGEFPLREARLEP
jgi:oligopeptide transport system substrate-binding protein